MSAKLTAAYTVEGLTCAACLAEVMERVRTLPHVSAVALDLVRDGHSCLVITSDVPLATEIVRTSVENAGFQVAEPVSIRPGTFNEPSQEGRTAIHERAAK